MPVPKISINESRLWNFPVFDFNGVVSGRNLNPGTSVPLQLGNEGWWLIYGLVGTMCTIAAGGLVDGSDINIDILDVKNHRTFFAQGNDFTLQGVPIEHVCGKYGNVRYLDYPILMPPGSRLLLYGSQNSGATPTGRSPLYVGLVAVLTEGPVKGMTMGSQGHQLADHAGEPLSMNMKFNFATTNLTVGQARNGYAPFGSAFYMTSIVARSSLLPTNFRNTVDPRMQEPEILLSFKDTSAQSTFSQKDPVPLALCAGLTGNREFTIPTSFVVNKGADLVATVTNQTAATISANLDLTFHGNVTEPVS